MKNINELHKNIGLNSEYLSEIKSMYIFYIADIFHNIDITYENGKVNADFMKELHEIFEHIRSSKELDFRSHVYNSLKNKVLKSNPNGKELLESIDNELKNGLTRVQESIIYAELVLSTCKDFMNKYEGGWKGIEPKNLDELIGRCDTMMKVERIREIYVSNNAK